MLHLRVARRAAVSIVGASLVQRDFRCFRNEGQLSAFRRSVQCHTKVSQEPLSIARSDLISKWNTQKIENVYQIKGDLGEGSFGAVRIGKHRQTGVERAVKVIPKSTTTPEAFHDEVHALEALDHPNIVKMIEYFQDSNNYYLVQELCTGPDFLHAIANTSDGKLPERDASIMIRQCIMSVIGCHAHGFIHRDIKLENFMTTSEDKNVKLIDFGVSARLSAKGTAEGLVGTDIYMAPEMLCSGKREYSKSVDVWSLGVVLFEMLSGELLIDINEDVVIIGNSYDFEISQGNVKDVKVLAQNKDGTFEVELTEAQGTVLHNIKKSQIKLNAIREIQRLLSDVDFVESQLMKAAQKRQLSADAIDLLRKMLCQDPALRITTSEALHHPFILQHVHESLDGEIGKPDQYDYHDKDLAAKLRHFAGLSQLQRGAFLAVAHLAPEETMGGKLIQLRHMFRSMDTDGDGEIDIDELRQSFTSHSLKVPQDLNELFWACHNPMRGTMSYAEFVAIELSLQDIDDKLCTGAFMLIDRNLNGNIQKEDRVLMC